MNMPPDGLQISTFDQLDARTLYAWLALRNQVFVVEQQCVYADLDGAADFAARHLLYWRNGELAAGARIIPPDEGRPAAIGRVVVAAKHRGGGLARILMQAAIAECRNRWPGPVYVQAQRYLLGFYLGLGCEVHSEVYLEDGIEHVDLYLPETEAKPFSGSL